MKVLIMFLLLCSCSVEKTENPFSILTLNVQNLFDTELNGMEYPEFKDPKKWNPRLYNKRLRNLGHLIEKFGFPDVIMLQEVENIQVLKDLIAVGLKHQGYINYYVIKGNNALGIGYISRFPVISLKSHQPPDALHFEPRPFMEVLLDINGRKVRVYNIHFKSKREGALETQEQRNLEGLYLLHQTSLTSDPWLIVGDFNEDSNESSAVSYPVVCGVSGIFSAHHLNRFWNHIPGGSYFYKGKWEQIDSMYWARMKMLDGYVGDFEGISVKAGVIQKWNGVSGYSDHLGLYGEFMITDL